jgi:hypothetical protein
MPGEGRKAGGGRGRDLFTGFARDMGRYVEL